MKLYFTIYHGAAGENFENYKRILVKNEKTVKNSKKRKKQFKTTEFFNFVFYPALISGMVIKNNRF